MSTIQCDVAVIGGGSGGYAAARTTAAGGLRTVVIDGASELGGLCILRGCMPTKALLQSSEILHLAQKASVWGVHTGTVGFDFTAMMRRKDALIGDFAGYRRGQLTDGRFELIRAHARFLDGETLELSDGSQLRARHVVVATGSVVAPPPLPALARVGFLTSDDALRATRLPKSLIVLGGGAVAVEFAQFFCRLGVKVTLIQRSAHLLRDFDDDAATCIETVFRREGMTLFLGTELRDCGICAEGKYVEFIHDGKNIRVEAEDIFNALGRSPNTAGLNLEAAGIVMERGRIKTDAQMRSSVPTVFAAGDCTGPYELVHLAVIQGEVAAHNILGRGPAREMDYRLLTSVVFTEPQVATAGLTEKEARRQGIAVRSASYPFNDHGKSMILDAMDGYVRLIVAADSGEILGGSCVGPLAGELIHEVVVAMAARMTAAQFAAIPHYHPTLAEIWTYPAEELA